MTQEKQKRNENIMLAIFEEFLYGEKRPELAPASNEYLTEFITTCEKRLSKHNSAHIRWHIAVFFSEFVINHKIADKSFIYLRALLKMSSGSFLDFLAPLDYLNWGGKQLYNELKNGNNKPE